MDFPEVGAPLSVIVDLQTEYRYLVCDNYSIFYRYEDGVVYVLRVLYGRRNYMRVLFDHLRNEPQR
ncbi:type II toxin-antitoxin system RelE/ParE family toxin [Paenibacillus macerans]|uniref:type II toxin-antitoxin system RelE/ParE family toxin n=1 Tax=Paenibacillus macerans TaxID=44252 RepID=UPI003D31BBCF